MTDTKQTKRRRTRNADITKEVFNALKLEIPKYYPRMTWVEASHFLKYSTTTLLRVNKCESYEDYVAEIARLYSREEQTAIQMPVPLPPPVIARQNLLTVDGYENEFPIDKGIPLPTALNRKYPWDQLEVGDSFLVPDKTPNLLRSCMKSAEERFGFTYTAFADNKGTRIWRVK